MLFSEVYGSYFNTVSAVLKASTSQAVSNQQLTDFVRQKAFAESVLSIPSHLKSGAWPLLSEENTSLLAHEPHMPLTTLQKRWLKALLVDPRIALFSPCPDGLEDVEPLFTPDMFVFFDQYTDGDPYGDENYIACFRTAMKALREHRKLRVRFQGHTGVSHSLVCKPYRMEYSEKDDKFRLLVAGSRHTSIINMARIISCELLEPYDPALFRIPNGRKETLVMTLRDERNALERALLHFSHFEKETERLDVMRYQITLHYDHDDETELLIRVLSFGPMIQVISPDRFIGLIRERLNKQKSCEL